MLMTLLICGILKNGTSELIYKTNSYRCGKHTYGYQGGKRGGGKLETEINIYTLPYISTDN